MNHFYEKIDGYFTFPRFYEYIAERAVREGWRRLVEVGVYAGQSAAYLGVELINRGASGCKLDLVDRFYHPHTRAQVLANLEPIASILGSAHEGLSWDWASHYPDKSLDFVFIDADHQHDAVRRDIDAWLPKVRPGGVIAGHDFKEWPQFGVIKAVTDTFDKFTIHRGEQHMGNEPMQPHYWPVWEVQL